MNTTKNLQLKIETLKKEFQDLPEKQYLQDLLIKIDCYNLFYFTYDYIVSYDLEDFHNLTEIAFDNFCQMLTVFLNALIEIKKANPDQNKIKELFNLIKF